MTPTQIQSLLAKIPADDPDRPKFEQLLTDAQQKVQAASGIQRAFHALKSRNAPAAEYLDALARGEEPSPFWPEAPPAAEDPDAESDPTEQRILERVEALLEDRLGKTQALVEERFKGVAEPLLALRAQDVEQRVRQWAEQTYDGFDWEQFRANLSDADQRFLESEHGLKTLVKAYDADHAEQRGYQRAENELKERRSLEDALLMPQATSGVRAVDGDPFAEADPTSMRSLMIAQLRHAGASDNQLRGFGYHERDLATANGTQQQKQQQE